jgi:hypothetical protein
MNPYGNFTYYEEPLPMKMVTSEKTIMGKFFLSTREEAV